jgi:hypothetical protein
VASCSGCWSVCISVAAETTDEAVYPEMFLFGVEGVLRIHHVDGIQPSPEKASQATPSRSW